MDEHLADCVLLGFCLSHFSFFFLAAEDSSLSWGCEMSVISADLLKSTFFFFTLRWAASGCSPAASSGVLNSCCSHVECCERICMNFQPLGFFFFYKLQFRTVFHVPSRPAFKIRSSQPPLVPAQLNKGHVEINDSQRKHLTVFCSTLRCWKCIIISLILTCVNTSAVHLDANGIRAARWRL